MPHIILSVTSNAIQDAYVPGLLSDLTQALAGFETIDSKSIKAYVSDCGQWVMGEGAPEGFVHVEVGLLSGRPAELRQKIATTMVQIVRQHYQAAIDEGRVGITLEVREFDAQTYQK